MANKTVESNIQKLLGLPDVKILAQDTSQDIIEAEFVETGHEIVTPAVNIDDKNLTDDFDLARRNIRELTELGKDALKGILDLAKNDDHPRPYEVAGQILKNLSEINKDLLDIHEKKNNTKAVTSSKTDEATNVTNAVFVGSTQELLDLMRNKKKNGPV